MKFVISNREVSVDDALAGLRLPFGYWYLATPYSKFPDGIEAAFVEACKLTARLIGLGVPVYSPIAHTHPVARHGTMDPFDHAIWLPADRPLMERAHGLIVAELPSWAERYGIKVEIEAFAAAGKPILRLIPEH